MIILWREENKYAIILLILFLIELSKRFWSLSSNPIVFTLITIRII